MRLILLLFLGLLSIHSCQLPGSVSNSQNVAAEVAELQTTSRQKAFLEAIYDLDQQVRQEETAANQQHGYNSPEHQASLQRMMEVDDVNLAKIEAFLTIHGHPTTAKHGKKAAGTPWVVIHHAKGGVAPRKRNFKYIYGAYQNGDIDGGAISFYLNRMYEKQYGHRIQWDRPFRDAEEIDTLMRALNLEEVVK